MFPDRSTSVRRVADDPASGELASPDAAGAVEAPLSDAQLLALKRAAVESTANAVVITDLLGTIEWTNPAFSKLTGYAAAEALGETPAMLKSGEHDRAFYQELWRTVMAGETWRGEFTNRRKDGTLYRGEQVITPVRSAGAAITHFVAVMNDVTARREAEAAQQATHRQLKHLLDHSPAVIYALKWENNQVVPKMVSENITSLLGFNVAETMSHEWWLGQLHPDDKVRAVASIGETLTHGTSQTEYRLRHRDGNYRCVEDSRRLIRDAAGQPVEFIGVWTDLNGRKRAEEALRDAAAQHTERRGRQVVTDLGLMVAGALLVFAGGHWFGWFESFFAILANHSTHPIADEATASVIFVLVAMVVFSYRRWRESRMEITAQLSIAMSLRTLHTELEARVLQRTTELAQANAGLRAEVAERQRAEAALRLFRTLVDNSDDTLEVIDPDTGRFLDVSQKGWEESGRTREEYLAMTVADIELTMDPANWPQISARIRGEGTLKGEGRHRRKDGTSFPIEFNARWVQLDRAYIVTVVRDISRRQEAEAALRDSQALYHSLVEQMPAAVFRKDLGGRYVFVNSAFCALGTLAPADFLGRTATELADKLSRGRPVKVGAAVGAAIFAQGENDHARIVRGTDRRIETEEQWIMPDGGMVYLDVVKTPVFDSEGKVAGSQGILFDITQRRQAEAEVRANETRYRALFENMLNGFAYGRMIFEGGVPRDFTYLAVNQAFEKLTGLRDVVGRLASEVMPGVRESDPRMFEIYGRVARGGGAETIEIHVAALQQWFDISIYSPADGEFVAVFDVITERKRAELAIRETESRFRQLAENVREVFWLTNTTNTEMLYVSPAFERVWGRSCASLIAAPRTWFEAIHPDDRERIGCAAGQMAAGLYDVEYRIIRLDGTQRWIHDRAFPVRSDTGEIYRIAGVAEDITERKGAEEALRQSEERYRALVDSAPTGILVNVDNRFAYVNQAMCRILGATSAEQLVGTEVFDRFHPDSQAAIRERIGQTIAGMPTALMDQRLLRLDGTPVEVETMGAPITFHGRPAIQVIVNDVTARKAADQQLLEQREQWRALVATSANAIFVVRDELLVMVNPAAAAGFGATEAELLGRSVFDFIPAELHADTRARLQQATGQRDPLPLREQKIRRLDGSVADMEASSVRFRFGGKPAFLVEARDITARKQAEVALKESEERYRALVDSAPTGIFVNVDDRFAYVNQAMCQILGATAPEQLLGQSIYARFHPDCHAVIRERAARVRFGETALLMDERHLRLDGSGVDVETVATRITFQGRPAIQVMVNDITRRKQIETVLRESERRFRDMLANVDLIAMTLDQAGRVTFCNNALLSLTGWQRDEAIGEDWFAKFLPGGGQLVKSEFMATIADGKIPARYENPIQTRAGELRDIVWNNTMLRDAAGHFIGVASIGEDVTERNRAATALREAKEQYQSIFQNSIEGIFQTTPEGAFRAANPAIARILGYDSPQALMDERRDVGTQGYVDPQRREEFKRRIEERGIVSGFEYEVYRKDGSMIWVSENARAVRDDQGGLVCYEGSMGDITERKRAEMRLGLQHAVTQVLAEGGSLEQTTRKVLETVGRGLHWDLGEFWTVDRTARLVRCTEVWHPPSSGFRAFADASRQYSFAPGGGLAGRVWTLGRAEWVADIAQTADCGRRALAGSLGLRSWIGFPVKLRDEVLGVMGFFSAHRHEPDDKMVSLLDALGSQFGQFIERQQLAEQFRQAQKMEAIGTLAGGIAHDFNNIIAAISGYTELAKMELGENTVVAEHLNAVLTGSTRAASLVRQILAFSRQQEHERRPMQLRHIVGEALSLLRATIPTTIAFDFAFDKDLPAVLADATQVHQVVMNLATNASHAMKDRAGRLGLTLERCDVDAEVAAAHAGLRPGDYVRLSVSDTGHGMDAATVSRIFEPFFTTKAPGDGTGLGLAVVHGIMQTHDGAVTVYSQPGEGTVFRLYFPVCAGETKEPMVEGTGIPQGHGERVMYVDDEEPLTKMGRKVLERLGYVVDARTNPVEALEAVRANPGRYDLVITDLAMPVMTGTELAQQLLAIRADLPIILITGYSATLTPARVQAMGIRDLLSKPISVLALGTTVARVLTGTKPA